MEQEAPGCKAGPDIRDDRAELEATRFLAQVPFKIGTTGGDARLRRKSLVWDVNPGVCGRVSRGGRI